MLVVVGLAMTAPAQSAPIIKVTIPFDFDFGKQTFPAGEYTLAQPMQHFLVLRDSRGQAIAQAFTGGIDSATPATATKLKFDYSEGRHTLTEVWQQADSSGERLYQAKSQAKFAKQRSTEAREAAGGSQP
jgi:hypothetical protein